MGLNYKVKQVHASFVSKESWLKTRNTGTDLSCRGCNAKYTEITDTHVGLATVEKHPNIHLCQACCAKFIAEGAEDIDANIRESKELRAGILNELKNFGHTGKTDNLNIIELSKIKDAYLTQMEEEQRLQYYIETEYIPTPTEPYLVEDFGVIEFEDLKHHTQICDWFDSVESSAKYFHCGKGYCDDTAKLFLKIGDKFYDVNITAEIVGQRQDIGEKIYWVESILTVSYEEVEKPLPLERRLTVIYVECTKDKMVQIEAFIESINVKYTLK